MANTHTTLTSLFSDTADAIREKNGSTAGIIADNFPTAIRNIDTQLGTTIGDVIASSKLTQINDDWIKADGTADVPKYHYPTLFSQLGLEEYRLARYRSSFRTDQVGAFYGGVYNPDDNVFVLVGIHDHNGNYGDRFGHKYVTINENGSGSVTTSYVHYTKYASNGCSDIIYQGGHYFVSCLRNPNNTATSNGIAVHAFTLNATTWARTDVKAVVASNRSMMGIAGISSGYVAAVGVKVDGRITIATNSAANDYAGTWNTYNMGNMTNSAGTAEVVDITGYGSQFLAVSKTGRNMFILTPNAAKSPTVNSTKAFSSYFTTIEGIDTVNNYAIIYGVYNGKAKIAYTNGAATGTWSYKEIGSFTPVNVGYANGRFYMSGYSGTTKYFASAPTLDGTWTVTEITNTDGTSVTGDIPYILLADNSGNYCMGTNASGDTKSYACYLTPVVKQPAITVSGKSNVFVKRTEGGVG